MIVHVDRCWGGNHKYYFELTRADNGIAIFTIDNPDNDRWHRQHAKEALDLIEYLYKVKRKSIKFRHLN